MARQDVHGNDDCYTNRMYYNKIQHSVIPFIVFFLHKKCPQYNIIQPLGKVVRSLRLRLVCYVLGSIIELKNYRF